VQVAESGEQQPKIGPSGPKSTTLHEELAGQQTGPTPDPPAQAIGRSGGQQTWNPETSTQASPSAQHNELKPA
jgi:hypothetical protein